MIRMQVQFTGEQAAALKEASRARGRSVSDLVRESVTRFLARDAAPAREERVRLAEEMLGAFDSGIPDLAEDHDRYLAEDFDD